MYSQMTSQRNSARRDVYHNKKRTANKRAAPDRRVQGRVIQLVVCVALFLAVYVGRGVFPDQLAVVGQRAAHMISADTDFRAAFSRLGESLSQKDSVIGEIGAFCVEVFGASTDEVDSVAVLGAIDTQPVFLSGNPGTKELVTYYLDPAQVSDRWLEKLEADEKSIETNHAVVEAVATEPVPETLPVGTVLEVMSYNGPALPQNYSMDVLSLGDIETTTPVFGFIRSEYGYRDHPIRGNLEFHNGVDIGGQTGDPIGAFSDGVVEYVGENDDYGLYLKIDHGNGVKSFYAHCSAILVKAGQRVAMDEKIAEVGATGDTTGPHLHLELTCNGQRLNPIYYIQYKEN